MNMAPAAWSRAHVAGEVLTTCSASTDLWKVIRRSTKEATRAIPTEPPSCRTMLVMAVPWGISRPES